MKNQNNQQNQSSMAKSRLNFMKNVRGISSFLNNSSNFWINSIQNTLCNCSRDENIIKNEIEESQNNYNINNNLFKVTNQNSKNENLNKNYTKEWTNEENEILMEQYFKLGNRNLKKLSELLKTKSTQQINYRIKKIESKNKMRSFTRQDDLKIIELVEKYGLNWEIISKNFPDFSPEILEERYYNKLDPKLKRTKFTEEEDEKIVALYSKFGNNWKEIAFYFPNRNANMIKNRFYSFLKKKNNIHGVNSLDKTNSFIESSSMITSSNNDLINDNQNNENIKFQYNNINSNINEEEIVMENERNQKKNNFSNYDNYLNDDFYTNQNITQLNRVGSINSGNSGNNNINNPNYFDKFNEAYQKVFSSKSTNHFNLNDSGNSNDFNDYHIDDDNDLLLQNNNFEEKEKLFSESHRLEELLKKIDSYDNDNDNKININNNLIKDNNLYNDLIQKKDNLNNYQTYLNKKLNNLKDNYSNTNSDIRELLEINDILLKLISVSKLKIIVNKKLNEINNSYDDMTMDL